MTIEFVKGSLFPIKEEGLAYGCNLCSSTEFFSKEVRDLFPYDMFLDYRDLCDNGVYDWGLSKELGEDVYVTPSGGHLSASFYADPKYPALFLLFTHYIKEFQLLWLEKAFKKMLEICLQEKVKSVGFSLDNFPKEEQEGVTKLLMSLGSNHETRVVCYIGDDK